MTERNYEQNEISYPHEDEVIFTALLDLNLNLAVVN